MGRPEIELDPKQVEKLAAQGLTQRQIASCLGVNYVTLLDRRKKYTEFADAVKRGQDKGIATVTNALFKSATEGNLGAQCFFLKNRDPENWKDRQEVSLDGEVKTTNKRVSVSMQEIVEYAERSGSGKESGDT